MSRHLPCRLYHLRNHRRPNIDKSYDTLASVFHDKHSQRRLLLLLELFDYGIIIV